MLWVLILGLLMTAVALPLAGRRVWFLSRVVMSGQPAPDRVEGVLGRLGRAVGAQVTEVLGQSKLLKWTVPGLAHFFVFWAFVILLTVYIEAYGALFDNEFAIPGIGHSPVLGFIQDFIALMCLAGIAAFAIIRLRTQPKELGRSSRFYGSHLSGAWFTLFMIFNVLWSLFLFRGAASALGNLPYTSGAFASIGVGNLIDGLPEGALEVIEGIGLLIHIGVMLVFLLFVLHSKHLHIFIAPLNVLFGRRPVALGAMTPMTSGGERVDLENIEELDEDTALGVGKVEDFTWKGLLDFETCTECGRCQSQCPAWNTDKPLSPKMLIMMLRDNANAKAPYLLAENDEQRAGLPADVLTEAERPLVGETEGYAWEPTGGAVVDNDVLWSCVSCGACVQQCPVDIEHVDHIMDMRRYQVLVEANFPSELNQLFKGLENKGNPWSMSDSARLDWTKDLPFDVPVVGQDVQSLDEVEWLFWVGCAGAFEDRAKKTTRAVAELLDTAGVSYAVLGQGETCTGDPARRAGNEFIFQGLAQENVETFREHDVKKVVSTCAHCFNTLKNEYAEFGVELEVVHHTQLLNRLVREGRLTPVPEGPGAAKRSITYHDPCFLGRHNQEYTAPRDLLEVLPGAEYAEMERSKERSFCCGGGGARMWMEETLGERINHNRTQEAVGTGADQIATGCPFCRVMLSDGLTGEQSSGNAREEVEVLDVANMLLASVKGESATKLQPGEGQRGRAAPATAGAAAGTGAGVGTAAAAATGDADLKAEPGPADATQTEGTVTDTADVGPAAKASGGSSLFDGGGTEDAATPGAGAPSGGGGSLFDGGGGDADSTRGDGGSAGSGGSLFDSPGGSGATGGPSGSLADTAAEQPQDKTAPADSAGTGDSLFDTAAEQPPPSGTATAGTASGGAEPSAGTPDVGAGGSLFDVGTEQADPGSTAGPTDEAEEQQSESTDSAPTPETTATPDTTATPESAQDEQPRLDPDEGGSLFDL